MARRQGHYTLSEDTLEYLKEFKNKSKAIDDAVQLYRKLNSEPKTEPKPMVSIIA